MSDITDVVAPVGLPKKRKGPAPKYRSEMCEEMYEMMCRGAKDCELYAAFKVSKDTFYRWLNEHDEFKEAHDRGLPECETWWERKGMDFMEKGNNKAYPFWLTFMKRKFPGAWAGERDGSTINIQQLNIINQENKDTLIERINQRFLELKEQDVLDIGVDDFEQIESRDEDESPTD